MPTDYSILRTHLLDSVRRSGTDPHAQFSLSSLRSFFESKGITLDSSGEDLRTIQQIIHEFYIEGIIIPGSRISPSTTSSSGFLIFPFYHITKYGEQVLKNTEYQPYDPNGYLQKMRTEIPNLDLVIVRYLEECLKLFSSQLLIVRGGNARMRFQKAVLLLIDSFGSTLQTDKAAFEKETNTFIISRKYSALWSRLVPIAQTLPNGLGDQLGNIIDRTFDIIRTTRNEAGHPSGNAIEKETVHANLLLFPIFCKRIYKLINHFSR